MILVLFALLLTCLGVASIYTLWKKTSKPKYLIALGWTIVFSSLYFWCLARGVEFGPAYWFISLSITAYLLIFFNATYKPRTESVKPRKNLLVTWTSIAPILTKIFLAGPLAGLASVCFVLCLVPILPTDSSTQLVIAAMLLPLCWAIACYWACAIKR